jgi:hypothetical protein
VLQARPAGGRGCHSLALLWRLPAASVTAATPAPSAAAAAVTSRQARRRPTDPHRLQLRGRIAVCMPLRMRLLLMCAA